MIEVLKDNSQHMSVGGPINSGCGEEYPVTNPGWDPEMAKAAAERRDGAWRKYEGLHWSIVRMAGSSTVEGFVPANFEADPDSPKRPIIQYVDSLAVEVMAQNAEIEYFGGEAAVKAAKQSAVA